MPHSWREPNRNVFELTEEGLKSGYPRNTLELTQLWGLYPGCMFWTWNEISCTSEVVAKVIKSHSRECLSIWAQIKNVLHVPVRVNGKLIFLYFGWTDPLWWALQIWEATYPFSQWELISHTVSTLWTNSTKNKQYLSVTLSIYSSYKFTFLNHLFIVIFYYNFVFIHWTLMTFRQCHSPCQVEDTPNTQLHDLRLGTSKASAVMTSCQRFAPKKLLKLRNRWTLLPLFTIQQWLNNSNMLTFLSLVFVSLSISLREALHVCLMTTCCLAELHMDTTEKCGSLLSHTLHCCLWCIM